jgi:hypothetical protein
MARAQLARQYDEIDNAVSMDIRLSWNFVHIYQLQAYC